MTSPTIDIEALKAVAEKANNGAEWKLSRDSVSIYEPGRGAANSAWFGSAEKAECAYLSRPEIILALIARTEAAEARIAELVAQRDGLVILATSIKADLEYLAEWGKIKPHEIIADIDAALSTIKAGGES